MSDTQRQRLEQGRAKHAYDAAENRKNAKDYPQYAKKVPMMIKTNGLGATLAFMRDKGGDYKKIYDDIENWFKADEKLRTIVPEITNEGGLLKLVTDCDSYQYRILTIEALAYLNWLRRFAGTLNESK